MSKLFITISLILILLSDTSALACTNRVPARKYKLVLTLKETTICDNNNQCMGQGYASSPGNGGTFNLKMVGRSGTNSYVYEVTNDDFELFSQVATVTCSQFSITILGKIILNEVTKYKPIELTGYIKSDKSIFGTYSRDIIESTFSLTESGTFIARSK